MLRDISNEETGGANIVYIIPKTIMLRQTYPKPRNLTEQRKSIPFTLYWIHSKTGSFSTWQYADKDANRVTYPNQESFIPCTTRACGGHDPTSINMASFRNISVSGLQSGLPVRSAPVPLSFRHWHVDIQTKETERLVTSPGCSTVEN